jgi:hypothetical protein
VKETFRVQKRDAFLGQNALKFPRSSYFYHLKEARLWTTTADREQYDNLATLFSIIISLDYLERAYVRDSITQAQ